MSLSIAIAIIVLADLALLGGLAWLMAQARRLTPHAESTIASAPVAADTRRRPATRRTAPRARAHTPAPSNA